MIKKILVGGVTAAVIVGAGGAALATTGDSSGSGSATQHTASQQNKKGKHPGARRLLRRLDHATIVKDTKKRGDVTRRLIRGTVTAVSPSSISIVSADKTHETFAVTSKTKVRLRSDGKGAPSSIDKVSTGDQVFAGAIGASKPVARRIVDVKGKK